MIASISFGVVMCTSSLAQFQCELKRKFDLDFMNQNIKERSVIKI